jgi:hypothetical protein
MLRAMAERALYYPEWIVGDPRFLLESLLYWDTLAVIVPVDDFRPSMGHPDRQMSDVLATVHKKFVTPIAPTKDQRVNVHARLSEIFATKAVPEWLTFEKLQPENVTTLAAEKLAEDTFKMLEQSGWARKAGEVDGVKTYEASLATANVIMAALAEECSSSTMPPITRDAGGFMTSCNSLLAELDSQKGLSLGARVGTSLEVPVKQDVDFLLEDISLPALSRDPSVDDFKRLLRDRDNPMLTGLRQSFVKKVDEYLAKLKAAKGGERLVIRRQFRDEHKLQLAGLHEELAGLGWDTLCSKSGVCAVLFGIATAFALPAALGAVGGLEAMRREYRQKRNKVLRDNWVSWASGFASDRFTLV